MYILKHAYVWKGKGVYTTNGLDRKVDLLQSYLLRICLQTRRFLQAKDGLPNEPPLLTLPVLAVSVEVSVSIPASLHVLMADSKGRCDKHPEDG